jgi:ERCC4-related helicase
MFKFKCDPFHYELHDVREYVIDYRIRIIQQHHYRLEHLYLKEIEELQTAISIRPETNEDTETYEEDSLTEIEFVLLRMHRVSTVMAVFAFFESSLFSICTSLQLRQQNQLTLSDISGAGINKFRKYLQKVCGINFNRLENEWSFLTDLAAIRNCLAHCDGDLRRYKNRPQVEAIAKRSLEISIEEEHLVTLTNLRSV